MIAIGNVLFLYVSDTNPPKKKYFFVLGITDDTLYLATFYVNSKVNPNVNRTGDAKKYNVLLKCSEYTFLKYDSYLDCTNLIIKPRYEIEWALYKRPEAKIFQLNDEQIEFLHHILRASPYIKGKYKKKYGFYHSI